jgi:hypothetical protein
MNGRLPTEAGELAILNVGDGDTKLSFDPKNPAECIRAARIVADMLKRGYALLIEVDDGKGGKAYQRATAFREDVFEYVIADFDPVTAAEHDSEEEQEHGQQDEASAGTAPAGGAQDPAPPRGRRSGKVRTVPAAGTRAVAVAATAGG